MTWLGKPLKAATVWKDHFASTALILCGVVILLASGSLAAAEQRAKLELSDCPADVQKTLLREADGAMLEGIFQVERDGELLYMATLARGKTPYAVFVDEHGKLLRKVLNDGTDHTEEQTELDFDECPDGVQETLNHEAHGFAIETVTERTTNGLTVYIADVEIDGLDYEVIVQDDGTLISKALATYEDEAWEWEPPILIII